MNKITIFFLLICTVHLSSIANEKKQINDKHNLSKLDKVKIAGAIGACGWLSFVAATTYPLIKRKLIKSKKNRILIGYFHLPTFLPFWLISESMGYQAEEDAVRNTLLSLSGVLSAAIAIKLGHYIYKKTSTSDKSQKVNIEEQIIS